MSNPTRLPSEIRIPPTGLPRPTPRTGPGSIPSNLLPGIASSPVTIAPNSQQPQTSVPDIPVIPDTPKDELIQQIKDAGFSTPVKCINAAVDVDSFTRHSRAYIRIVSLIRSISLKVSLKQLPESASCDSAIKITRILDKVDEIMETVPPLEGPRRFGNLAFRTFQDKLIKNADTFLQEILGKSKVLSPEQNPFIELTPYFLGSFGSRQRLDFGTGHELSFLAFFGGLCAIDLVEEDISGEDILFVFERYFNLIRKIIMKYSLEPAGSHGVWGLDDHFHLPYILGSAQIVDITQPDTPTPRFSPKTVLKRHFVERHRKTNLYFSAIAFINEVKKGPFHEHSPTLNDVAHVATWHKIHRGMVKMYIAEVLGKFPVVQHFYFGTGFYPWVDKNTGKKLPSTEIEENFETKSAAAMHLLNSHYLSDRPIGSNE